jgi:thioredoxin reductase (NADPH)
MPSEWDVVVIGAGPAGLSAAADVAAGGLRCLCLDKMGPGGALINLGPLQGLDEEVGGPDLVGRLTDKATEAGVELGFSEVVGLSGSGPWTVETAEGESHAARAVIVASGLSKGRLGVPNEESFEGRGLSHCAVCDGPLFAGQPVVVAGAEGWAVHEAQELAGMVGHVTVVSPSPAAVPAAANIEMVIGRIVALEGADGLESVAVEQDGARRSLPAQGVFVYLDQSPAAEFVPDSLARDAARHIVVNSQGEASAATIFAAGDVRAGSSHRVKEAIADGKRAAQAAIAALR